MMRRLEMESKPQIPAPRSVSGDDPSAARIGPYRVVRHLVSGPGAQMMEGAREDGTQVLLQLVRCRAARNAEEEEDRNAMLESVTTETTELAAELSIQDHGSTEAEGEWILWWVLPWDDR